MLDVEGSFHRPISSLFSSYTYCVPTQPFLSSMTVGGRSKVLRAVCFRRKQFWRNFSRGNFSGIANVGDHIKLVLRNV